ncbi:MAG: UPF0149 family protein [Xanthomonadaceae bacterium]|jgi:uncharacterized protein YgfB (UPF0149 family)|nr:UPF0149 family protein [Xanthomonadaceae bacterium]
MSELPDSTSVAQESTALGLGVSAAELHGALCGWLCGGGEDAPDWPARVLADPDAPVPATDSALQALRRASVEQLEDGEFGFELLLPEATAPLDDRAGALFEWCQGFLGGFGLAAGAARTLSEESQEALQDLARLAGASVQEGAEDDQDKEEDALSELEEFVRVAALLLHGDCVLGPRHRNRLN